MSRIPNVKIILCRCGETKKLFGMRTEEIRSKTWTINWAFPVSDRRARAEKYDSTTITGSFSLAQEFPGCPYCGNDSFFSCGACGKLTCWNAIDEQVKCSNCNATITLSGEIDSLSTGNDL